MILSKHDDPALQDLQLTSYDRIQILATCLACQQPKFVTKTFRVQQTFMRQFLFKRRTLVI